MNSTKRIQFLPHLLPQLVIAAVALCIGVRHLNEPPGYIHAWAQSDNYSLALGFRHNHGDFFHPQTLIYNKQQYGFDDPESLVTGCDLPLHHWLVAVLMGITNSTQPWVFRGLTLAVAILGLWALYLLAFALTRSPAKSLLVATVTATALNVRQRPSTDAPVLEQLEKGRRVVAASEPDAEGWVKVHTGEVDGFVKAEYLGE